MAYVLKVLGRQTHLAMVGFTPVLCPSSLPQLGAQGHVPNSKRGGAPHPNNQAQCRSLAGVG